MNLEFCSAQSEDLQSLVKMLADDEIGSKREDISVPLNQAYLDAFDAIQADPNNILIVVKSHKQLIGMLQLTFIPYLTCIFQPNFTTCLKKVATVYAKKIIWRYQPGTEV